MTKQFLPKIFLLINTLTLFIIISIIYQFIIPIINNSVSNSSYTCDSRFCTSIIDVNDPCYPKTPDTPTCLAIPNYFYGSSTFVGYLLLLFSLISIHLLNKRISAIKQFVVLFFLGCIALGLRILTWPDFFSTNNILVFIRLLGIVNPLLP